MSGTAEDMINTNKPYIPWLQEQYISKNSEIASLCVGAFILAETGLLDGKEYASHWLTADEFKRKYPKIKFKENNIITETDRLYTSGGANSYWNLLIYLIAKHCDRDVSKYFEVEIDRISQLSFINI